MTTMAARTDKLNLAVASWLAACGIQLSVQSLTIATGRYPEFAASFGKLQWQLNAAGVTTMVNSCCAIAGCCGLLLVVLALLALLRRGPRLLKLLRAACIAAYLIAVYGGYSAYRVVDVMYATELPEKLTKPQAFFIVWAMIAPALLAVLVTAIAHLQLWRQHLISLYLGTAETGPAPGDRLLEDLRTHGRDPHGRKSLLASVACHFAVLVLIPYLLGLMGCVSPYRVPKGSGNPVVALVKIVKPKKKKKKRLILNPNSAIYFQRPDIDDSRVIEVVKQETELTYRADPNAQAGKMGRGGGKTGGWPDGMENHLVRFIRLQYNGHEWDDGMDAQSRADQNFLEEFRKLTGFKTADHGEAHRIGLLRKYPKGYAPPFVYMTGEDRISTSDGERKILRQYLLDGGMLFADCGSTRWHRNFIAFSRQVFPDLPMVEIADDDPIFQMPYQFGNGAPPLWHHGGRRALGIKHKGRWLLFYHPGDVNDAWKTGHSGLSPDRARGAFQIGVNIVYYAFTNYLEQTRKHRK